MTTTTIQQQSSFIGELTRTYNGARFSFTFIMDQNSPKGIFAFGPDPPSRHPGIYDYTQNSTNFAVDAYSLYQTLKIWKGITDRDQKDGRTPSWTVFKNKILSGTCWESLEIASTNIRPEDHPHVRSEDYYSYKFNAMAFSHYFQTSNAVLNTCISWGSDQQGALEVLNEIYVAGILGYFSISEGSAGRSLRAEMESHRDHLRERLQEFFKPVDLRLTDAEFRAIERRVMGRPLMRELGLEECPDCPICMEQIKSRQHCTVLPCKHLMHVNCAKQWLMEHCTKPTCPLCRCCCRPKEETSNEEELSTADTEMVAPLTPLAVIDEEDINVEDFDSMPELEEDYDSMPELLDEEIEYESHINSVTESDSPDNIISVFGQEITPINNQSLDIPIFPQNISAQDLTEIIRILADEDPVLRAGINNINNARV